MERVTSEHERLLECVRSCEICVDLPFGPRPILQFHRNSKILIVGQAPGRKTHEKNIPFDDASGDRLRTWLGVNRETFYYPKAIAVLPMGFCFPGTANGADLPPRKECAPAWRSQILNMLSSVELTIVLGRYAIDWHLPELNKLSVTDTVKSWKSNWPNRIVLPHPSPRNNRWLKQNPFFEKDVIPELQARVSELLKQ